MPITWKNVAGRSNADTAILMKGARESLSDGFDTLGGVVDDYEGVQKANYTKRVERNTDDVQDYFAGFNSVEELEAAQASGATAKFKEQFGGAVDRDAVRNLGDTTKTSLLDNLDKSLNREDAALKRVDAATARKEADLQRKVAPAFAEYQAAVTTGDKKAQTRILGEHGDAFKEARLMDDAVAFEDSRAEEILSRTIRDDKFERETDARILEEGLTEYGSAAVTDMLTANNEYSNLIQQAATDAGVTFLPDGSGEIDTTNTSVEALAAFKKSIAQYGPPVADDTRRKAAVERARALFKNKLTSGQLEELDASMAASLARQRAASVVQESNDKTLETSWRRATRGNAFTLEESKPDFDRDEAAVEMVDEFVSARGGEDEDGDFAEAKDEMIPLLAQAMKAGMPRSIAQRIMRDPDALADPILWGTDLQDLIDTEMDKDYYKQARLQNEEFRSEMSSISERRLMASVGLGRDMSESILSAETVFLNPVPNPEDVAPTPTPTPTPEQALRENIKPSRNKEIASDFPHPSRAERTAFIARRAVGKDKNKIADLQKAVYSMRDRLATGDMTAGVRKRTKTRLKARENLLRELQRSLAAKGR